MDQPLAPSGGRAAVAALAAGILVASCIVQTEPPPPSGPPGAYGQPVASGEPGEGEPGYPGDDGALIDGDYACSIETSDGYRYPPFRCTVYTADDGSQMLEKVAGSQRFRGRVLPDQEGFAFEGTFYCPYGACDQEVNARFASTGRGGFRGAMESGASQLTVSLQHMPGGFTYGGVAYGGATYATPPRKIPR